MNKEIKLIARVLRRAKPEEDDFLDDTQTFVEYDYYIALGKWTELTESFARELSQNNLDSFGRTAFMVECYYGEMEIAK